MLGVCLPVMLPHMLKNICVKKKKMSVKNVLNLLSLSYPYYRFVELVNQLIIEV